MTSKEIVANLHRLEYYQEQSYNIAGRIIDLQDKKAELDQKLIYLEKVTAIFNGVPMRIDGYSFCSVGSDIRRRADIFKNAVNNRLFGLTINEFDQQWMSKFRGSLLVANNLKTLRETKALAINWITTGKLPDKYSSVLQNLPQY